MAPARVLGDGGWRIAAALLAFTLGTGAGAAWGSAAAAAVERRAMERQDRDAAALGLRIDELREELRELRQDVKEILKLSREGR